MCTHTCMYISILRYTCMLCFWYQINQRGEKICVIIIDCIAKMGVPSVTHCLWSLVLGFDFGIMASF